MPITTEQLRNYSFSALAAATDNALGHVSQAIPSRLHNVDGFTVDLRDTIRSSPIAVACATSAVASRCTVSNFLDERFSQSPTFPRIRNNSAYAMDADSVCNTLEAIAQNAVGHSAASTAECMSRDDRLNSIVSSLASHNILSGMTQNAACGDLAVTQDRHMRAAMSRSDILRKLEEDYRRWEVERIKKLISSKATIRYIMEVK